MESVTRHHSIKSPAEMGRPELLRSVDMPPRERVKNSSSRGPIPSSGERTLFDLATPAK